MEDMVVDEVVNVMAAVVLSELVVVIRSLVSVLYRTRYASL